MYQRESLLRSARPTVVGMVQQSVRSGKVDSGVRGQQPKTRAQCAGGKEQHEGNGEPNECRETGFVVQPVSGPALE